MNIQTQQTQTSTPYHVYDFYNNATTVINGTKVRKQNLHENFIHNAY